MDFMKKIIFKNVNLINGTLDMNVQNNVSILIEDNIIKKIDKEIFEENVKTIDLQGKYMIPGLINLHVHLPGSGKVSKKARDTKKLVRLILNHKCLYFIGLMLGKKNAKLDLYSGTTTLRAVGGVGHFDTALRDKINKGKIVGPRILASDYAVTVEKEHMAGTVSVPAYSIEEAINYVNELADHNVDWIKIMITGGVIDATKLGEPGELRMSPDYVKACVEAAHNRGLKVSAHVESFEGCKVAIENGVDTIEHGSDLTPEMIELFKKNKSSFICTFSPAIPIGFLPMEISYCNDFIRYNSCVVAKNILKGVRKAIDNNVSIGLGTDTGCPFITHYGFWRELEWFSSIMKIERSYALYLATLGNAKIIELDKEIGSIEEGKIADMVICENNPLDNFANLKSPYMVVHNGNIIKKPKIKYDKYVEKHLDTIMNISADGLNIGE